jgi:hypothetical protein
MLAPYDDGAIMQGLQHAGATADEHSSFHRYNAHTPHTNSARWRPWRQVHPNVAPCPRQSAQLRHNTRQLHAREASLSMPQRLRAAAM